MFPVSDVIPSRTTPYVTISIITLNTLAFVAELRLPTPQLRLLAHDYGVVPADFKWLSTVTSLFLHAGWMHFGGNMLYLWIFGDNVEDRLGRIRFLVFYIGCGMVAAFVQATVHPHSIVPMIGASGAIAGVMGAYFVFYPQSRILTAVFLIVILDLIEIPALYFLGIWFVMQLFSGVGAIGAAAADGGVAFWAHVAGLAAGALVGGLTRMKDAGKKTYWK